MEELQPKTRRENEIWQACDELLALGSAPENITGDAIRDRLLTLGYKKGSPNEIYKFRNTWKQARGVSLETQEALNREVSDPINRAVSLVYEQIYAQNTQEVEALKKSHQEQIEILTQKETELTAQLETLKGQHEILAREQETLKNQKLLLEQSLETKIQELEKSQSALLVYQQWFPQFESHAQKQQQAHVLHCQTLVETRETHEMQLKIELKAKLEQEIKLTKRLSEAETLYEQTHKSHQQLTKDQQKFFAQNQKLKEMQTKQNTLIQTYKKQVSVLEKQLKKAMKKS